MLGKATCPKLVENTGYSSPLQHRSFGSPPSTHRDSTLSAEEINVSANDISLGLELVTATFSAHFDSINLGASERQQ